MVFGFWTIGKEVFTELMRVEVIEGSAKHV